MITRRKNLRSHKRLPIDLQYFLQIDDHHYSGHISNISISGAYLATIESVSPMLKAEQQGVLNIKSESGWVSLLCQIDYVGSNDEFFPAGAGITFCSRDYATASLIWNLCIEYLVMDDSLFAPLQD